MPAVFMIGIMELWCTMTGITVSKKELLSNSLTSCVTVTCSAKIEERGKRNIHPSNGAASFLGTRLEELNIQGILDRAQVTEDDLTTKEKKALHGESLLIVGTASQLTKILNLFAKIAEEWISSIALVAKFCIDWYEWAKENEGPYD